MASLGSLFSEYINLKNKFSKEFAKKVLADMWKQYVDVDTVTVNVMTSDIDGFQFHILNREQVEMSCDVTDHYIDTNRPVQDHIAWKPIKITMVGRSGEYFNNIAENIGHSVAYYQVMGVINSYLPKNTNIDMIRKVKSTVSRMTGQSGIFNQIANTLTSNIYGILLGAIKQLNFDLIESFDENILLDGQTNQQRAFLALQGLWRMGLPVHVTTSWREYDNMLITDVKPLREDNADITEFSVTMKQIQNTQTIVTDTKYSKERTAQQKSEPVNNGETTGKETTFTLDTGISNIPDINYVISPI